MARQNTFRERHEAKHRPRWSPLRALMFLAVLAVCGGVGYLIFSPLLQTARPASSAPSASTSNQPAGRGSSIDQVLLNIYLSLKQSEIDARSSGTGDVPFAVQNGDTPATIGTRLKSMGMLSDAELFRLLARARGVENNLQAGEYTLKRGMTMDEILIALQHGRDRPNVLTIVEGRRVEEIAGLLDKQGIAKASDFINATKMSATYNIPELNGRPNGSTLEGFLFPDTYDLPKDATAQQLVQLMLRNFDKKAGGDQWSKPPQGLTAYQTLIIASIVEREAQVPSERPIIASVYENRIKQGMRLEADPTVQYGMGLQPNGSWWKTPVMLEEYQRVNSPYNTYTNDGLPPTPICSPGADAIKAAFQPAKTEFLFFVGKGDGTHAFAKTFEEHQANVAKYQK